MKIVRIEHDRCGEPDKYVYYVIPDGDGWTEDQVRTAIDNAQAAYLKAYEVAEKIDNPGPTPETIATRIADDNLTIGEVKRQYNEHQLRHQLYEKAQSEISGSFEDHLRGEGLIPVSSYEGPDLIEATADWGHRHGKRLRY